MGARKPKSEATQKAEASAAGAAAQRAASAETPAQTAADASGPPAQASRSLDLVLEVPVRVSVEVGTARLLVREVLQFEKGSVVELDRQSGDPADILVNGRVLARGELTVVDDRLAVRVVEVVAGGAVAERA